MFPFDSLRCAYEPAEMLGTELFINSVLSWYNQLMCVRLLLRSCKFTYPC